MSTPKLRTELIDCASVSSTKGYCTMAAHISKYFTSIWFGFAFSQLFFIQELILSKH